jgi:hypothetical protein
MEQLETRTAAQSKHLFAVLKLLGLMHYRDALALEFSEGRTSSTKLLTKSECSELISKLQEQVPRTENFKKPKPSKARRKFFALFHNLGWELENGKLDYRRINNWCLKYGSPKKGLKDILEEELPGLITQLEKILQQRDDKDKPGGDEDAVLAD